MQIKIVREIESEKRYTDITFKTSNTPMPFAVLPFWVLFADVAASPTPGALLLLLSTSVIFFSLFNDKYNVIPSESEISLRT